MIRKMICKKRSKERKNKSCDIIKPGLLEVEGKVESSFVNVSSEERLVDKKNVVLLMPRLLKKKCEKKASIVGTVLSLDLGKKFDGSREKFLGFRACSGEIYDEKPRLWEGVFE